MARRPFSPSRWAFSRYEGEFEPRSGTVTTDSPSWQKIFGGNAVVFAESMCIRRFEGQLVARLERVETGSQRLARKNILGEAQTLADLMGISRYRGRVCLSASRWWKAGTDREWRVPLEVGDHFHDPDGHS